MTDFSTGAVSDDQELAGELRSIDPTGRWEVAAILATVLLADVTLYRGHGYAGLAVFFLGALGTLYFGKRRRQPNLSSWIVAGMQALLLTRPMAAQVGQVCNVCNLSGQDTILSYREARSVRASRGPASPG